MFSQNCLQFDEGWIFAKFCFGYIWLALRAEMLQDWSFINMWIFENWLLWQKTNTTFKKIVDVFEYNSITRQNIV